MAETCTECGVMLSLPISRVVRASSVPALPTPLAFLRMWTCCRSSVNWFEAHWTWETISASEPAHPPAGTVTREGLLTGSCRLFVSYESAAVNGMTVSVVCGTASAALRFALQWSEVTAASMCAPYHVVPPSGEKKESTSTPACCRTGAEPESQVTDPGHVCAKSPPFVMAILKVGVFFVASSKAIVEMLPETVYLK